MIVTRGLGAGGGNLVAFGLGRRLLKVAQGTLTTVSYTVTTVARVWVAAPPGRVWNAYAYASARSWLACSRAVSWLVGRVSRHWRVR